MELFVFLFVGMFLICLGADKEIVNDWGNRNGR